MKAIPSTFSIALLTAALLVGCGKQDIQGTGEFTTETRETPKFNAINITGAYDIILQTGKQQKIALSTNSNLLPHIETFVKDDALVVKPKSSAILHPTKQQTLVIVANKIEKISVSGTNKIDAQGIDVDNLTVELSGQTQGKMTGKAKYMALSMQGTTNVDAKNLRTEDTTINISGTGDVIVHTKRKLEVGISGTGKVAYLGNPSDIHEKISGTGEVIPFRVK